MDISSIQLVLDVFFCCFSLIIGLKNFFKLGLMQHNYYLLELSTTVILNYWTSAHMVQNVPVLAKEMM